jgi:DNA-binding SARP family transcriptional activator
MRIYAALGRTDDVKAQYKALEDHLKKSLGVTPAGETQDLLATLV